MCLVMDKFTLFSGDQELGKDRGDIRSNDRNCIKTLLCKETLKNLKICPPLGLFRY